MLEHDHERIMEMSNYHRKKKLYMWRASNKAIINIELHRQSRRFLALASF